LARIGAVCAAAEVVAWAAQSKSTESRDALQVCEPHLDLLALALRLLEGLGPGQGTGNVASGWVLIAWNLAKRNLRTALRSEFATCRGGAFWSDREVWCADLVFSLCEVLHHRTRLSMADSEARLRLAFGRFEDRNRP
jgi:hypothetical protein